ncbi:S-ribosylhomocysteine lyase [Pseudoruminococcus massiliensis]|uniref:S-ribosylhomocysteine lyase n=1 Tax=Pseudoruminococcus massiliensis TaxID=2086583 RepID=UPI000D100CCC|nr:S-ribosylhomocysteine lyase [Pseudoruminococcus massiliensis]
MKTIASFTINHDLLDVGMYTSRVDGDVVTYDVRMKKPNAGEYLEDSGLHTFEHLFATFARNSEYSDSVVYVGPMGCRTGFYFLVRDSISPEKAINIVYDAFCFIADFEGTIPGSERKECGNYVAHDLVAAKKYAKDMLPILSDWTVEKLVYPR